MAKQSAEVAAVVSTYGSSVCEPASAICEQNEKINIGYGVTVGTARAGLIGLSDTIPRGGIGVGEYCSKGDRHARRFDRDVALPYACPVSPTGRRGVSSRGKIEVDGDGGGDKTTAGPCPSARCALVPSGRLLLRHRLQQALFRIMK
jgi:hypothetical protein